MPRVRIRTLPALVPRTDGRTVPLQPKRADPFYLSPEHRAWSAHVIARAGARCEWSEDGPRCTRASPDHRMFADHIVERRDDPTRQLDPSNGRCLCGTHHALVTARNRAARAGLTPPASPKG